MKTNNKKDMKVLLAEGLNESESLPVELVLQELVDLILDQFLNESVPQELREAS